MTTTHGVLEQKLPAEIKSIALDRSTGILYLSIGLLGGSNAVTRVFRYVGAGDIPRIEGIATDPLILNKQMTLLTFSSANENIEAKLVVAGTPTGGVNAVGPAINIVSTDGTLVTESDRLRDATGVTFGEEIYHIAASPTHVFAFVEPNLAGLTTDSGIALIEIEPDTLRPIIKDATTGSGGNKAVRIAGTIDELKIGTDATILIKSQTFGGITLDNNERFQLHWSNHLERLYVGVNGIVSAAGGGVRSVVVARVTDSGHPLKLSPCAPDTAFDGTTEHIVGTAAGDTRIDTRKIKTMYTSTGASYLIVNGEVDPLAVGRAENRLFALPLVDNPIEGSETHGTLARKDSPLDDGRFVVPATDPAHLPKRTDSAALVGAGPMPMIFSQIPDNIVVIGDTVYISMGLKSQDVDRGVFYSQALFDQNGKIARWTPWSKRAFPYSAFPSEEDEKKRSIISFFTVDAFTGKLWATQQGSADEDVENGISTTFWGRGRDVDEPEPRTLLGRLNKFLGGGCFSALDLDQSTRGLATHSPARYALFGGNNTVVFTRVSRSNEDSSDSLFVNFSVKNFDAPTDAFPANSFEPSPAGQEVTDLFYSKDNLFPTSLPVGQVVALEYSRRLNASTNQNFFFAGGQNGLYAFADANGTGFTIEEAVDGLGSTPFVNGRWHKITSISGSVVALKTTGIGDTAEGNGGLYVLTQEATKEKTRPIVNRIYRIPFYETVADMIASIILIGETQTTATNSDLSKVKTITGMETLTTSDDGSEEQVVIATNYGLYVTRKTGGAQTIVDQADAQWAPIPDSYTKAYSGIFGVDNPPLPPNILNPANLPAADPADLENPNPNPIKSTVWAVEIADEKAQKTLGRTKLQQLSTRNFSLDPGTPYQGVNDFSFMPYDPDRLFGPRRFNSIDTSSEFDTVPPTAHFWSDGARRALLFRQSEDLGCRTRFLFLPHNTPEWGLCGCPTFITDPPLNETCIFYWIKQIGATGILMLGTSSGVVGWEAYRLSDIVRIPEGETAPELIAVAMAMAMAMAMA